MRVSGNGVRFVGCRAAMSVIGLDESDQQNILRLVAAILHLGNVTFAEERNFARVEDEQCN